MPRRSAFCMSALLLMTVHHCLDAALLGSINEKLISFLMADYKNSIIPALNNETFFVHNEIKLWLTPKVDIKKQQFSIVYTVLQTWVDSRLAWDENTFPLQEVPLRISDLWTPDIVALEANKESKLPSFDNVLVSSNGTISYKRFVKVISRCKMNIYFYPFDQHDCRVNFVSSYSVKVMRFKTKEFKQTISKSQSDELIVKYITCKEETRFEFAAFSCTVTFFQSYIITAMSFLIPFYLIMILDIATCFLPLWGDLLADRLSAKLTLLLTFSFCLYSLGEVIPGNMDGCVPIIVQVFVGALFFITIDVMETIFIVYCYSWKLYPWMSSCLSKCRKTSGKSGSKSNLVEDNNKGGSANDEDMEARRIKSCRARADTADTIFFWIYLTSLFVFITYTMYLWFQGQCADHPPQNLNPL